MAQRDHKTHVKQINFPLLRRALKLVVDDLDDNNPTDIAYAYSHSGCVALNSNTEQANSFLNDVCTNILNNIMCSACF